MNVRAILIREATISAVINGALSVTFFLLLFGYCAAPKPYALGTDCIPQAFMVSLMAALVPVLILRRKVGAAVRPILLRGVVFAVVGTLIAGGAAFAVGAFANETPIPVREAALIKTAFGAMLGAIVTPAALLPLLVPELVR